MGRVLDQVVTGLQTLSPEEQAIELQMLSQTMPRCKPPRKEGVDHLRSSRAVQGRTGRKPRFLECQNMKLSERM